MHTVAFGAREFTVQEADRIDPLEEQTGSPSLLPTVYVQPEGGREALVAAILELKRQKHRCEAEMVAQTIMMGRLLGELKLRTKVKEWGRQLGALELHPRIVSRLLRIGAWGRRIGLNESDLYKLPHDPLKLERIAALDRDQLDRLYGMIDCRQASRPALIAAIKRIVGDEEPAGEPRGNDRVLRSIIELVARLNSAIDGLGALSPESRDPLCAALGNALAKLSTK
jgi:hypothetical protein